MNIDIVTVVAVIGAVLGAAVSFIATLVSRKKKAFREDVQAKMTERQIKELASEYARIRATMHPGDERTLQMEIIVDKLRTLIQPNEPDIAKLTLSDQPGERLAAAVALQVRPHPEYLHWLGERLRTEQPFIGYHAAVALLAAARALDKRYHPMIRAALEEGFAALGPEKAHTDRWAVLEETRRQLDDVAQRV